MIKFSRAEIESLMSNQDPKVVHPNLSASDVIEALATSLWLLLEGAPVSLLFEKGTDLSKRDQVSK